MEAHAHICPRCYNGFNAPVRIEGLMCQPCIEKRDPEQLAQDDATPTRPDIPVPARVFAAHGRGQ